MSDQQLNELAKQPPQEVHHGEHAGSEQPCKWCVLEKEMKEFAAVIEARRKEKP